MKINQKFVTTFALALTFSIAGCSGSGSSVSTIPFDTLPGSGSGTASRGNPAVRQILAASQESRAAAGSSAANTPLAGSVTQSSNADSGITTDRVEYGSQIVGISGDGTNPIRLAATWTRTNAAGASRQISNNGNGVVKTYSLNNRIGALGVAPVDEGGGFYKEFDDGHLWVYSVHKGSDAANVDYLARGIWLYIPKDLSATDQFESIAFADGSDEFTQSNLLALTGTATYNGEASGVYSGASGTDTTFFDAEAALTAEFGTNSALGTVSGSISGFDVLSDSILTGATITLGSATIGTSNGGFFTGDTSLTLGGDAYAGKWGGQFLGNTDNDVTAQPEIVLGTFGATTAGGESFLGTFDAAKQ